MKFTMNILSSIKSINLFIKNLKLISISDSGSVACLCLVIGDKIFCANLGDSRAILSKNGVAI